MRRKPCTVGEETIAIAAPESIGVFLEDYFGYVASADAPAQVGVTARNDIVGPLRAFHC